MPAAGIASGVQAKAAGSSPQPASTGRAARTPGNPSQPKSTAGRTPGKPKPSAANESEPWADDTETRPSRALKTALVLAALGAVALAAAGFVPVSPAAGPGFTSWPWLALLALAPAVAAIRFAAAGKPGLGGGLVLGLAALAPGRLVLDLQFAVNGPLTIRPELYLPDRFLDSSAVGGGFWLLVAGHVLTAAAGVVAWRALRNHDEPERRRWRLLVPLLAVVAGAGLLTAPVHSDNGFLLARAAFEGPWPALGGYLLIAAALPLAAALALAAPAEHVARGALAGLAAAAFGVAAPPVLAGLFRDDLHVTWGPALALVATAIVAGLAGTRLTERTGKTETDLAGSAKLPGLFWWRLTTGLLGLATAIAALIGAFAPQVAVTALNPGATTPVSAAADSPARWFLLVAALVLAVPAAGVLVPKTAAVARPVLGVAWAGIVLAGTAVLNTALTATQAGNLAGFGGAAAPVFSYDLGAGAAWTFAALVLAALAALAAAGTGVVEREDAGDATEPDHKNLAPVAAGAVLAVAAFGLPVFAVPGYVAAGLWSHLDTPSWGLLTAAAVVVGATALATRSRPKPAAALLVGAALLTALHAAELPLVGGTLGGASPAAGFWVALAATAALLAAAGMSAAGKSAGDRSAAGERRAP
ncbi:hypothetical protein AMES_0798 [Amycolatopsis mediterranei S699]|uniref:Uncharacterized protein n=1 Tax=Amycolatopsis mediterranei (strain U-32) TaxID=749927 RepID=A0A0H3CX38_AMYMU|nr:hypothetical protein [Amycolatopsis mediterranei]ADJ42620.1 conserved hypothetical protein [Amycolatopsis mediterranei U32]AFO74334.1 hypothetical protein AMES_0798 [Amycolatopsis mediterranei S699]AGT81463.1 hypothetical protein B737_0799 [Amycolatopsis mediterranei RB]KDO10080.1 hypothetical protein DV26_15485 [Amycolatopsis mediterranei]KDU85991.1 hypothetical protein DV36_42130 [Amycolatopsis mediterranei]